MIICGFPGIGKSTLAKSNLKYIDFESTNFDKTNPLWYIDYCKCILDLDRQGYIVFCSTHENVTKYLSENQKINIIFPGVIIKNQWVERVKERYEKDPSEKNKRALTFVEKYLEDGISSVYKNYTDRKNVNLVPIKNIDYDLEEYVKDISKYKEIQNV